MAEEKEKSEEAKPKKKPLDIMFLATIGFALLNLGALGGGAYLVYASTLGWRAPQITEEDLNKKREASLKDGGETAGPLVFTMEKFTVNLSGDPVRDPKRTIQVEVNLEMLNKEGFEEVIDHENRAKARDRIIQILGNKTFNEVESIQGKLFLKDQIATEINGLLDKGIVKDVYFSDFVVQ